MPLHKIAPCNSCGKVQMCVSHDYQHFYCNRCIPFILRNTWTEYKASEPVVNNEVSPRKNK